MTPFLFVVVNKSVRRCLFFSTISQFYTAPNKPVSFLDNLDEDLSNISVASIRNAKVITSEQGFNKDITKSKNPRLKIPDVCHYKNISCSNWLEVFRHLGMKF